MATILVGFQIVGHLDFISHLKSGPLARQSLFDHSNSGYVWIWDPHWSSNLNSPGCSSHCLRTIEKCTINWTLDTNGVHLLNYITIWIPDTTNYGFQINPDFGCPVFESWLNNIKFFRSCKMCGEKQSVKQIFWTGHSAKDGREQVTDLLSFLFFFI